tara:strand:+ start:3714 stop:4136 length:423 start_codon:yes stop_codon:yes gene_type:complete
MSGRPKQKQYQYSKEGKFLKEYDSLTNAENAYKLTKGNFYSGKEYRLMPDETFICNRRVGRDAIIKFYRIEKCPFCKKNDKRSKTIEVFNLLGEKLAEFNSLATLGKMTGKNIVTIFSRTSTGNKYLSKNGDDLIYKYKK